MKIAIYSPYQTVAPHFENELELMQLHLDQGDEVEYLACLGELQNCDFNAAKEPEACRQCVARRQAGVELLEPRLNLQSLTTENEVNQDSVVPEFKSPDDLIAWKIDQFDIGYAVLSSLVSLVRDPEPCLKTHQGLLAKLIHSAVTTYHATLRYLEQHQPDRVYVFNGRFAAMRAVLRACQQKQVDCWAHERGCDLWHYELFKNHLPHDLVEMNQVILQHWQAAESHPNREEQAAKWFEDRRAGAEQNWHSFTQQQEKDVLPSNWRSDRHNISLFCSSQDEFRAIGPAWQMTLYPNQNQGIRKIAAALLEKDPSAHLYVRLHPNLIGIDNADTRELRSMTSPNMTVIMPEDEVDTYRLVTASHTVVSFGSSVGIEAVYWGRPSVLLGPCYYSFLQGTYQPRDHDEVIELLTHPLEPQDKTAALVYGYWLQTRGIRFQYFEPESLFAGRFKGQIVHAPQAKPQGLKRLKKNLKKMGRDIWQRCAG